LKLYLFKNPWWWFSMSMSHICNGVWIPYPPRVFDRFQCSPDNDIVYESIEVKALCKSKMDSTSLKWSTYKAQKRSHMWEWIRANFEWNASTREMSAINWYSLREPKYGGPHRYSTDGFNLIYKSPHFKCGLYWCLLCFTRWTFVSNDVKEVGYRVETMEGKL